MNKGDVKLVFKDGSIIIRESQLKSFSKVLDTELNGSCPSKGDVKITHTTASVFKEFRQFLDGKEIELTMENVNREDGVMYLAN